MKIFFNFDGKLAKLDAELLNHDVVLLHFLHGLWIALALDQVEDHYSLDFAELVQRDDLLDPLFKSVLVLKSLRSLDVAHDFI